MWLHFNFMSFSTQFHVILYTVNHNQRQEGCNKLKLIHFFVCTDFGTIHHSNHRHDLQSKISGAETKCCRWLDKNHSPTQQESENSTYIHIQQLISSGSNYGSLTLHYIFSLPDLVQFPEYGNVACTGVE